MEEEARDILRVTLARDDSATTNLADAISRRFKGIDDTEIPIAPREPMREPPTIAS